MDLLSAYLPMDRRQALVRRKSLPEHTSGSAIFADISGFTPLTEMLGRELGPKRGAEELTRHLNQVYDALVAELHRFGGSVIGFSGDAITCWLDGDNGERAVGCALAMQAAMGAFAQVSTAMGKTVTLELKTAVSTGKVRRFLVGNPDIQIIDILCGRPIDLMAEAEHLANRGEVVMDAHSARLLGDLLVISEWRGGSGDNPAAAVIKGVTKEISDRPWKPIPAKKLTPSRVRPWLLKPVFERLQLGKGDFLAELRPAVALFLRFTGINFEEDPDTQAKLDEFIRRAQQIIKDLDGTLLQLTIGDKGSYFYAGFGAPFAHEDDALRAVRAAFALQDMIEGFTPPLTVQIGIAQGQMRVGAYGGSESRTYGVLGDSTNLAARLMQASEHCQILATNFIYQESQDEVQWQKMPAIKVKGKTAAVEVFQPLALKMSGQKHTAPQEQKHLVGRAAEVAEIKQVSAQTYDGQGQILGITGDAGIGKSILANAALTIAFQQGTTVFSGECQAYGSNTGYLVWRPIWQQFFGLGPGMPVDLQIETVRSALATVNPVLEQRLPLLAPILNLPIPENDLTRSLDAKIRKTSLESMLVDCLQYLAHREPIWLVFEDVQWIDPLSHDLLEMVARVIGTLPVLIIMVFRPATIERLKIRRVRSLPNYHEIALAPLTQGEIRDLVTERISRQNGENKPVAPEIIQKVVKRAEGNPFYAEQSIDYLTDSGVDLQDPATALRLELPSSLQSLVLSRIDQLTESQKITIKIASVIGRVFRAALLWGIQDSQEDRLQLRQDLDQLVQHELDISEDQPDLTYFFRHILTQEVAYESLPFASRALLHEEIAAYLEQTYPDSIPQFLDFLAFHYGRSNNRQKKIDYLLKAAEAARQKYANLAAIDYYQAVLEWLEPQKRVDIMLQLCQVLEIVGQWEESYNRYQQAEQLAVETHYPLGVAKVQAGLGELYRKQGNYTAADTALKTAKDSFTTLGDKAGIAQTMQTLGSMSTQMGKMDQAREFYQASLTLWQELGQQARVASLYSNLGIIARLAGDYDSARDLTKQALDIRRVLEDRWAIAVSLNNLGNVALDQNNHARARFYLEEAVALQRQVGDKYYLANALNNLANVIREQQDFPLAFTLYTESVQLTRNLGDRWALAYLLEDIACLASLAGKHEPALTLVGAASAVREAIKSPLTQDEIRKMDLLLEPARAILPAEAQQHAWETGRNLSLDDALDRAIHIL